LVKSPVLVGEAFRVCASRAQARSWRGAPAAERGGSDAAKDDRHGEASTLLCLLGAAVARRQGGNSTQLTLLTTRDGACAVVPGDGAC